VVAVWETRTTLSQWTSNFTGWSWAGAKSAKIRPNTRIVKDCHREGVMPVLRNEGSSISRACARGMLTPTDGKRQWQSQKSVCFAVKNSPIPLRNRCRRKRTVNPKDEHNHHSPVAGPRLPPNPFRSAERQRRRPHRLQPAHGAGYADQPGLDFTTRQTGVANRRETG
jgi:hypothetical protein